MDTPDMIPPIIHLVWIGPMTEAVHEAVERHKRLQPDYEVRLHRDQTDLNPLYQEAWEKYTPWVTFKSDLLRWSVIEKYGGWYFDVDCVPYVPVRRIETEYGLDGQKTFVTSNGMFIDASILAGSPAWDGWETVHRYFVDYRPQEDGSQAYACFSWDLIRAVALRPEQRSRWVVGSRERFNLSPGSKVEPFVLRARDVRKLAQLNAAGNESSPREAADVRAAEAPDAASQENAPGLLVRVGRYSRAVGRWIAAGRPVREEEEVQRIYQTLCQPCEHFDAGRGICKTCGCRVWEQGSSLTNKIRMGTERCPRKKW
jgi:hypothetical protein